MARTVVGHFPDRASADRAWDMLMARGFDRDDVSIIGRGREGHPGLVDDEHHVTAGEGAATGALFGLLLGAAAMLIPGIGPIVAVGPISAALAGAVTGAVTGAVVGGVAGALIDAGVPEEEARYYDERFQTGGILMTVRADDSRYAEARAIMEQCGADVGGMRTPTGTPMAGTTPATSPEYPVTPRPGYTPTEHTTPTMGRGTPPTETII